jgi:hypothetical protein
MAEMGAAFLAREPPLLVVEVAQEPAPAQEGAAPE